MEKRREQIAYGCMGAALACCAVFSGGLTWQSCLPALLLLAAGLCVTKQKLSALSGGVLLLLLGLSVVSVFTGAGNPQTGLYEFEKFACFAAAVAAGLCFAERDDVFLKILFYAAVITAAAGLVACCSVIAPEEFVFRDRSMLRLQSFIKYANVTASFLACGYFAFLELFRRGNRRAYLYGGGVILIALYFTVSKAGLPIFLVLATLYLARRREVCKQFLLQNLVAVVLLAALVLIGTQRLQVLLFFLIVGGVAVCGVPMQSGEKSFRVWLVLLCVLVAGAGALLLLKPSLLSTFLERMAYMRDGLTLIPERPLLGSGFGSWRLLQFRVQRHEYGVNYMHNGILQMAVENGLLCTLLFCGLVLFALWRAVKGARYHIAVILLMVLLHCLIDCDLSFGLMLIVLGFAVGSVLPTDRGCNVKWLLVAVLLAVGAYMLTEYTVRSSFEFAWLRGDYDAAAERLETLERVCPLDAQVRVNGAALEGRRDNDAAVVLQKLEEARKLSPNDHEIYENYMLYWMWDGDFDALCMTYLNMAPKREHTYRFLKDYLNTASENHLISAEEYTEVLRKVEERRQREAVIDRNELLNTLANQQEKGSES